MLTTVQKGNQVTIPEPLVQKLGLTTGAQLDWSEAGDDALLVRKPSARAALAAKLCGAGAQVSPERDACAELSRQREDEDNERARGA